MLRKLTHRRNGATQGKTRLGSLLLSSLPPAFLPQTHPPFPVCPTHTVFSLCNNHKDQHTTPSATATKISQTFHDKFLLSLWKPTPYIPSWLSPFPDLVCLGNHPNTLLHISELLQVPTVLHVRESLSLLYYMFGKALIALLYVWERPNRCACFLPPGNRSASHCFHIIAFFLLHSKSRTKEEQGHVGDTASAQS